ncbi:unnamed protein product [Rotaria socialis]|uniref:Uncharacterized protein n=1 Tax=Rotaria socialis TaxID=392032 RepID=A0A820H1A8_9BILA|nr:unnamed protein product [Rotaria socialis]CAF4285543.1 unnamed protein product [Rotaria socialis]
MKVLIFTVVFICIILSCVQVGSSENIEPASKLSIKYLLDSPSDAKLLALLRSRRAQLFQSDDDDDNNSNENYNDMSRSIRPSASMQRRFLFPSQNLDRRSRPLYGYGRKSHWDTFFG